MARAIGGVALVVADVVYGASQWERRGETGCVCGVPYGGIVPVVAGVVYGASQWERWGETGHVPYGGVVRWWQVWSMVAVSGRGGARQGAYLMEVSCRWWQVWSMVPVSRRGGARQGACYVAVGGRLAGGGE